MPRTQSWGTAPYGPDDPEFEARVRSAVGSPYVGAVDKSRATRLPWDMAGLLGFYTNPAISEEGLLSSRRGGMYSKIRDRGFPVEGDRVYAGRSDATTPTWAHEFRHRALEDRELGFSKRDEGSNRLLDAYYAGSKPQWVEAVEFWRQWKKLKTSDEAEADLVGRLRQEEMGFTSFPKLSEEWKASRASGMKSYGPSQMFRGLLDPERADAVEKVNAPWKIWASPGLLVNE